MATLTESASSPGLERLMRTEKTTTKKRTSVRATEMSHLIRS